MILMTWYPYSVLCDMQICMYGEHPLNLGLHSPFSLILSTPEVRHSILDADLLRRFNLHAYAKNKSLNDREKSY